MAQDLIAPASNPHSAPAPGAEHEIRTPARVPRGLVALLAVASGASVANLYYVQPLLNTVALLATGTLSVVAQIVVPLASTLAAPEERGQVVGTVMSGLLVGILSARTLSGLVAQAGGWRLVFALAAGAMLLLSLTLARMLPRMAHTEPVRYRSALRSIITLIAHEPVLRQRMALGALGFGCFSVLWTSIAFLLSAAPYGYNEAVIGLFGLAGAAGALVAPLAGTLTDRGHGRRALGGFLLTLLISWGLLALGRSSLIALIAGIILLDLGVQGAQISNQAAIYRLHAQARSRLTTAYMVSIFLGGILGSTLSSTIYAAAGWRAVCWLGVGMSAGAIVIFAVTRRVGSAPRPS
jgi:predicted MFS family arabinose efflux permease